MQQMNVPKHKEIAGVYVDLAMKMVNGAYCKYCGMILEERDRYCPECGSLAVPFP